MSCTLTKTNLITVLYIVNKNPGIQFFLILFSLALKEQEIRIIGVPDIWSPGNWSCTELETNYICFFVQAAFSNNAFPFGGFVLFVGCRVFLFQKSRLLQRTKVVKNSLSSLAMIC